jgi:cobyrinic acid a,c-diamide synthase
LDRIVELAAATNKPPAPTQVYPEAPQPKRARIAIAKDKAFSFYYQDSLDLLEAWGAELAPFSPMEDAELPTGAGGIYIGGGFPEMFAAELAGNAPMHAAIQAAVGRGVPVYAECGGLMYLGRSLSGLDGVRFPMVGAIPAVSAMSGRRQILGYREVESRTDSPLMRRGQRVRAHEFHWSTLEQPPDPEHSVYRVVDQDNRADGFQVGSVWASYVHIHLGSDPSLARRFVDTCARGSDLAT